MAEDEPSGEQLNLMRLVQAVQQAAERDTEEDTRIDEIAEMVDLIEEAAVWVGVDPVGLSDKQVDEARRNGFPTEKAVRLAHLTRALRGRVVT